ncbi:MAG: hypothetical protein HUU17_04625 [Chthonomonadales bacterium]|nr:hypothetical protein [Chthonomonadales bacterium]
MFGMNLEPTPQPITLSYKPDLEEATRRWLAFWEHDLIDRPPCVVRAPLDEAAPSVAWPPYMAEAHGDMEATARQIVEASASIWYGGEAIPAHTPSFGPDMMAAWFGAPLVFQEYGTSWAETCVDDWDEALPLAVDPENYWWQRMLRFCRVLSDAARGKMLVAHLDLHSNCDTLLALRNGDRLCLDLIDRPEIIDRAMADVRSQYVPIYQALYDAGRMGETGTTGWVHAYHPVRTNTIQCDFAALIGPRQFRRWAMPALEEEAAFLGHCVYHLDGPECLVHLPDICSIPGLDCIQWTTGARNKPFIEWMDLLKDIQGRGVAVWIPCSLEEIPLYHRELRPELVYYDTWARTRAEGEAALQWLKENT